MIKEIKIGQILTYKTNPKLEIIITGLLPDGRAGIRVTKSTEGFIQVNETKNIRTNTIIDLFTISLKTKLDKILE